MCACVCKVNPTITHHIFCHICNLEDTRPASLRETERDYFVNTDEPELEFDDDGTELSSAKEGKAGMFWELVAWLSVSLESTFSCYLHVTI